MNQTIKKSKEDKNQKKIRMDQGTLSDSFPQQNEQDGQSFCQFSEIPSSKSKTSNKQKIQERYERYQLNKHSKGFYESMFRVITKHTKVKSRKYQTSIIQMIKSAVQQPNSTDNFLIQQLADYFTNKKEEAFREYLKWITSHARKRKNENLDNKYFDFAANQILKELKQIQIPKKKDQNVRIGASQDVYEEIGEQQDNDDDDEIQ